MVRNDKQTRDLEEYYICSFKLKTPKTAKLSLFATYVPDPPDYEFSNRGTTARKTRTIILDELTWSNNKHFYNQMLSSYARYLIKNLICTPLKTQRDYNSQKMLYNRCLSLKSFGLNLGYEIRALRHVELFWDNILGIHNDDGLIIPRWMGLQSH